MRTVLNFIVGYLMLSAAAVLVWLLWSYPNYPKSLPGWLWLFGLALPIQTAFEFIGELLWNNKATRAIELKTANQSFSWIRIGYRLFGSLLIIGGIIGVSYWLKTP
jgi:hypothetical protein